MEKKNYSINSELTKLRSAIDTKNTLDKLLCNVNLQSCSCLNVTALLVESRHNIWNLSHLKPQPNWPNDWAMLWILICCIDCVFHHDTYVLRVNLHSAVAWLSRISLLKACTISEKLSGCNWNQTHCHLGCMWTLNQLAKLNKSFTFVVSTYLYGELSVFFILPHTSLKWIYTL